MTFDDLRTFDDLKIHGNVTEVDLNIKEGYRKIFFCARQAERDNLHYFWVDTCCIDKLNNTELSEAINSMFLWYRKTSRCYVYLSDVEHPSLDEHGELAFRRNRWFDRCWTLQELLAPNSVEFFSKRGSRLGDKTSFGKIIHGVTGIPVNALLGSQLFDFSVAARFSWTKNRQTTREEDAAYCLLGIFDMHLPLTYGEGKERALKRLQKEIKGSKEDTSGAAVANNTESVRKIQKEKLGRICNRLSAPNPSTNYHKACKQRQDDTGLWLLESDGFIRWRADAATRL